MTEMRKNLFTPKSADSVSWREKAIKQNTKAGIYKTMIRQAEVLDSSKNEEEKAAHLLFNFAISFISHPHFLKWSRNVVRRESYSIIDGMERGFWCHFSSCAVIPSPFLRPFSPL